MVTGRKIQRRMVVREILFFKKKNLPREKERTNSELTGISGDLHPLQEKEEGTLAVSKKTNSSEKLAYQNICPH